MCEFKVGDLVKHDFSGNEYTVTAVSPKSLWFKGFNLAYDAGRFHLVERKQEQQSPYIFKVGDKGKTRHGMPYEVLAITSSLAHANPQLVCCVAGSIARRELDGRLAFDQKQASMADLMPPTKTVWRVELTGVKSPGTSGLLDMTSTRYYDTEENARKGIARGVNNYITVKGPFPEEREA